MKTTQVKTTIFIAAPIEARKDIVGGCQCKFCVAHPDKTPQWDTIAVDVKNPKGGACLVHYPEFISGWEG